MWRVNMFQKKHLQGAFVIAFILLTYTPYLYVQEKKQECIENVSTRLQEKGYHESDIISIESYWHLAGLPNYQETVTFKNEPNIRYIYWCEEGQREYYSVDRKEVPIEQLKNYDVVPLSDAYK